MNKGLVFALLAVSPAARYDMAGYPVIHPKTGNCIHNDFKTNLVRLKNIDSDEVYRNFKYVECKINHNGW